MITYVIVIPQYFQDFEPEKKNNDEGSDDEEVEEGAKDFNYILNMPLWTLSKERKEALLKQVI